MKYQFSISFFLMLGLTACNNDEAEFSPSPEPEEQISYTLNEIPGVTFNQFVKTDDDQLFAATSAGVYQLRDNVWVGLSDPTWEVFDIEAVTQDHLFASLCSAPEREPETDCESDTRGNFYLAESIDGGQSWEFVASNFGIEPETGNIITQSVELEEKIHAISFDTGNGMLYATGYDVLAISGDLGRTWLKLAGFWQGFARGQSALTIDYNSHNIWYGGQGAIENSILRSYNLLSQETTTHDSMTDILNEPGAIKSIRFHPEHTEKVYAIGEPGIIVSNDNGNTWEDFYLNAESRFYFDLLINPEQPLNMYTARWTKVFDSPQPFILERSIDGGVTWEALEYKEKAGIFGGVWSMHADYDTSGEGATIYFGLYKGGVMQVDIPNTLSK